MPSVTKLLNRKKYEAATKPAQAAAAPVPEPVVEIAPQAIEAVVAQPAISVEESAPNISISLSGETPAPVVAETPTESAPSTADDGSALPSVVAPSRRRGTRSIAVTPDAPPISEEPSYSVSGVQGAPPVFSKTLVLEKLDLKAFQKAVGRHKKSTNMKKLDCLGYFSTRFSEIAYFEVNEAGSLAGVLGFGNLQLVMQIRDKAITAEALPSVYEAVTQGEIFLGPLESLRPEDQAGVAALGFTQTAFLGAFPVMYKKNLTGLWVCAGEAAQDVAPKEIEALKKFFSNLAI
ncbi:MAG: hypothetical protein HY075_01370 [Deltaproteobacteria bacterium]|nr:hypothetical protein [Deltaproteobacteria bacterium]